MSLPTVEKTWQYSVGQTVDYQPCSVLLAAKNSLKGFTHNPMVVKGSSDGSTAGMDAVDRLTGPSSFAAHTWLVLHNAAGAELLLHYPSAATDPALTSTIEVLYSPSVGFSGGSTTARPTASDELWVGGVANQTTAFVSRGVGDSSSNYHLQVLHSTDGKESRVLLSHSTIGYVGAWLLGELKNAPTGLANPRFCAFDVVNLGTGSMWQLMATSDTATGMGYGRFSGEHASPLPDSGTNGFAGVQLLQQANEISSEWPIVPMYLHAFSAPHTSGSPLARLGRVYDTWLGSTAISSGSTYPGSGSPQFAQFGAIVVPWNGSAVVV
jgi:hypothetical protein